MSVNFVESRPPVGRRPQFEKRFLVKDAERRARGIVRDDTSAGPPDDHDIMKAVWPILDEDNDRLPCRQPRRDLIPIATTRFRVESSRPKRGNEIAAMNS